MAAVCLLLPVIVICLIDVGHGFQPQRYVTMEGDSSSNTRHKRFLSFNNDESNIRIEMVFAIPFLHIPIGGKAAQGPFGSDGAAAVVDVNAKSLLSASVLLFMLFFVIPKLVRVFVPGNPHGRALTNKTDVLMVVDCADSTESEMERTFRSVEDALSINGTACWQQAVCSLVRDSTDHSAPWAALVNSITNIKWMERLTSETAFGEAVQSAKSRDEGCQPFYSQCPLRADQLSALSKETARRYMNHLIQLYNAKPNL